MPDVMKFTSPIGETFFGLILQWHNSERKLCEVFWDYTRHPILKEYRCVQSTVPHESPPKIGWSPVTNEKAKVEILPASEAKVKWECQDILMLQNAPDLAVALKSLDMTKYRVASRL